MSERHDAMAQMGVVRTDVGAAGLCASPSLLQGFTIGWIRANLARPSLGLVLFLAGLHGMYFYALLFPRALFEPAQSGTYRYLFLSWVLITVGAALETWSSRLWLLRRKPIWVWILATAVLLLTATSIIDGEPIVSILSKSFPFFWLIFVPTIGSRERNWAWLWVSFLVHGAIGVVYSLYAFFVIGATTRLDIVYLQGQNFLALCLYMGGFAFLFLPALRSSFLRGIALGLFGFQLLQAYFYANRLTWFLLPIQVLIVVYAFLRVRGTRATIRRLTGAVMVFLLVAVLAAQLAGRSGLTTTLSSGYQGLMARMLQKGTLIDTILENERWYEIKAVTATMDGWDWMLGKGLTARWSDPGWLNGEERYMSHNTWLNAFYWGGVLLFLATSVPLWWAVRAFMRSRRMIAICCAGYVLLTYLKFPAYLITYTTPEWVLSCLALGVCVWQEDRSAKPYAQAVPANHRSRLDMSTRTPEGAEQ